MGWRSRTVENETLFTVLHTSADPAERQEARATLIVQNRALVASIAKRYNAKFLDHDDLVQEGLLGLIRAIERYDPSRGFRFSTYATFWIRQAIGRAIDTDSLIAIPVHRQNQKDSLARVVLSLDDTRSTSENPDPLLDLICDTDADPAAAFARVAMREELAPALASLPDRERRAINLRYGLLDDRERSLGEVGDAMGMSREGARQMLARALCSLRKQVSTVF